MGITALDLLATYTERTGLTGTASSRRYLWTDAFAVCALLGAGQRELALRLVDQVHHVLGRHRDDDTRRGWISGLSEGEGELHPTLGGLRIGKKLPERGLGESLDERIEWDRDGQYFHYLTKWMHALDQVTRVTGDQRFQRWACELADVAHRRFTYELRGARRMYWKMSIDLTRPLVPSMGHHDPLEGFVTCLQLGPDVDAAALDYRRMIASSSLATSDPLGIGGLLVDAYRLAQLDREAPLRAMLVAAARSGLARYVEQPDLRLSANHRLAFRELGLAIGLAAADAMKVPELARFVGLRRAITEYWLDADHRQTRAYREHRDINDVMLATSLAPTGFLVLA